MGMGATTSHRDVVAVLSCSTVCFAGSEFNIQMRERLTVIFTERHEISLRRERKTCILAY